MFERYFSYPIQQTRSAAVLLCSMSIVAFVSFAAIDPLMMTQSLAPLYWTRLGLVIGGLILLAIALKGYVGFPPILVGIAICLWTGGGVVILTGLTGGTASPYWTMVMVNFFAVSLTLPLRPLTAFLTFASVALFYVFWMWRIDTTGTSADWAVSNAGIWLSILVSVLSVDFLGRVRIREKQDRINMNTLNTQLRQEIYDREQAESTARRAQKLEAVGQLAAGLAHEINNLLTIISISADAIHQEGKADPAFTQRIIDGARQGGQLAQNMLVFARKNPKVVTEFDVHQTIAEVMNLIGSYRHKSISTEMSLAPKAMWVKGDKALIGQVFLNCCLNGLDAMEAGGTLTISTSEDTESKSNICIRIADTGCGMNAEEMLRAFEPFYTTKAPGKGTGLGLSVAYGTIQDHNGTIQIKSQKNQGTTIEIRLPMAERPKKIRTPRRASTQSSTQGTVLVIDDDPMIRTVMCETLKSLGYDVVSAENGVTGLSLLDSHQPPFEVVILDMVMPLMGGQDTFYHLRERQPDLPVLLYSGYTKDEAISKMLSVPFTAFLSKPFTREQLRVELDDILLG